MNDKSLVELVQEGIKKTGLKLEFDGETITDIWGKTHKVFLVDKEGENLPVPYYNPLTGNITLRNYPPEIMHQVGYSTKAEQMATTLGHEVSHANILPLELGILAIGLYAVLKNKISGKTMAKTAIGYYMFLHEFITDMANSVINNAPWAPNHYTKLYDLGKMVIDSLFD